MFDKKVKKVNDINLIPLINIIFLLLIFFLVTGSVTKPDIHKIEKPISLSGNPPSIDNIEQLSITIVDRKLFFNDKEIKINNLVRILRETFHNNPEQPIFIKADAALPYHILIDIMQIIEKAGGNNLIIATEREQHL